MGQRGLELGLNLSLEDFPGGWSRSGNTPQLSCGDGVDENQNKPARAWAGAWAIRLSSTSSGWNLGLTLPPTAYRILWLLRGGDPINCDNFCHINRISNSIV